MGVALEVARRYGCEFSFEVGHKSPSGEGLYAFKCKKANDLVDHPPIQGDHVNYMKIDMMKTIEEDTVRWTYKTTNNRRTTEQEEE